MLPGLPCALHSRDSPVKTTPFAGQLTQYLPLRGVRQRLSVIEAAHRDSTLRN